MPWVVDTLTLSTLTQYRCRCRGYWIPSDTFTLPTNTDAHDAITLLTDAVGSGWNNLFHPSLVYPHLSPDADAVGSEVEIFSTSMPSRYPVDSNHL